ncbi:MAG TPA: hypothetical protein VGG39_14805 [Polyangiaceae bacterium]|jgi:hypothetical protein
MKSIATTGFALLVASVVACGGAKKDADAPANADETVAAAQGGDTSAPDDSTPSSSKPVGGDDSSKKSSPCGGFEIPDLGSVLSQAACEVDNPNTAEQKDVKDILDIKVIPDSPRIAPGSTATITVVFKNKGKVELPLNFVVDPEPRFDFEVYTLKGARVDAPKGSAPPLPEDVANAPVPDPKIARVTLAQQGTAKLTLKWDAVKYKWASKERAKGALPGHGYPRDPAGPLPKGKYILRVITPLTNVFEGVDHDVSQPRVEITVGSMP